jgi:hypothetical protein
VRVLRCRKKTRNSGALNKPPSGSKPYSLFWGRVHLFAIAGIAMIRFLLRAIGLLLLAVAFFFVVYDGVQFIANQRLKLVKLADAWAMLNQGSLHNVEEWLKAHAPWLWDPVVRTVFEQPTWLVLTVAAMILMWLGRKKKRLIGYARD